MDPPSSFIFENIPSTVKHHLLLKTKHLFFSKAGLKNQKNLLNKIGNQGMVTSSKEGNTTICLTSNSYYLMHQSSDKEFKTTRWWQMHRGLPCVVGESGSVLQISK
jgi:L,D-peptidoglycan transpeptidase YkuD (ErfK/YbiS/YcfS/YnhG family)